jgi:hypothetical protein
MKVKFVNSYWPNAIGVIGVAFAIAFAFRGCSNILIEKEKTEQVKIQNDYEKVKG